MIGFVLKHAGLVGGGVGLLLVTAIVIGLLANFGGTIKLLRSIVGFFIDKARDGVEWARKDHDWWRIGCFSLALLFGLASFAAYDQRQQVIVVTRTAAADAETCKQTIAGKDALLSGYTSQQAAFAAAVKAETDRLLQAQQQNADVIARVAAEQAAAAKSNAQWWAGYEKRPDSCKVAQQAMDVACAGIGEY